MADDDDDRGSAPDPWDEIVADGLGEDFGDETVPFADAAASVESPVPEDGAAESGDDVAAAAAEAVRGDAEDVSIEDWLTNDEGASESESPALSVFVPEENATGMSGIDGETGVSTGARDDGPEPVFDDDGGDAQVVASNTGDADVDAWADIEPASITDVDDGAPGTIDVTAAAAPALVPVAGQHPAKAARKSGGFGKAAGIALGGLLAIPVTGAILLYGLGQDPVGISKVMPSFLLPAKFQSGNQRPLAVVADPVASPIDVPVAEPATPEPAAPEPVASEPLASETVASESVASEPASPEPTAPEPDVSETVASEPVVSEPLAADEALPATADPEPLASADVAAVDDVMPVETSSQPAPEPEPETMPMPDPQPDPQPQPDALAADAPGLDALVPEPLAAEPPVPAQPTLDTTALDEAVGEAAALGEALGAVDDRENRAYTLLRTRWYRSLARMAEEFVALEHAAAASGRPLEAPPENVALLQATIGNRESLAAELATLAPDWLAYAKRGSDGVVLPVTFDSARKVGPYWTARAALARPDGTRQSLTLISRTEPQGVAGDTLLVTGVVLDGGVIWAVDVRGVAADEAAAVGL